MKGVSDKINMSTQKIIDKVANKVLRIYINRRYDIAGVISCSDLGIDKSEAHEHAATNDYFNLVKIILMLKGSVKGKTIVDLGCGSGSAICVFRWFGFKMIYGVDLSSLLVEKGKKNFSNDPRIKIDCCDARVFKERVDLVYMFNPFPSHVLIDSLKNLKRINPEITVIYRNPIFLSDVEGGFENFRLICTKKTANSIYAVFLL